MLILDPASTVWSMKGLGGLIFRQHSAAAICKVDAMIK